MWFVQSNANLSTPGWNLYYHFSRNKPEGCKTALAITSIFTSQLLELMTWTLILPFLARLDIIKP